MKPIKRVIDFFKSTIKFNITKKLIIRKYYFISLEAIIDATLNCLSFLSDSKILPFLPSR
jgi:hypothetical protein